MWGWGGKEDLVVVERGGFFVFSAFPAFPAFPVFFFFPPIYLNARMFMCARYELCTEKEEGGMGVSLARFFGRKGKRGEGNRGWGR